MGPSRGEGIRPSLAVTCGAALTGGQTSTNENMYCTCNLTANIWHDKGVVTLIKQMIWKDPHDVVT